MAKLNHTDKDGKARMVDVGGKAVVRRMAQAAGEIRMSSGTAELIRSNEIKKGDVLTVAQIAGINAAKQTGALIPLCHPLGLDSVKLVLEPGDECVRARSEVAATGRTGVEMEALMSVSVALLAVYDMVKAVDKNMSITDVQLIEKVKEDV